MDFLVDKIEKGIVKILEENGYELYKFQLVPLRSRTLVRVFIDNDTGITIGDCEKVSRLIEDFLFVENIFEKAYTLEVSSPGVDRPLERQKDFQRNLNRKLKVVYMSEENNKKDIEGRLVDVNEEGITLEINSLVKGILYKDIVKARVIPEI